MNVLAKYFQSVGECRELRHHKSDPDTYITLVEVGGLPYALLKTDYFYYNLDWSKIAGMPGVAFAGWVLPVQQQIETIECDDRFVDVVSASVDGGDGWFYALAKVMLEQA